MQAAEDCKPFNLLRWFAWLSPVVIIAIAVANGWLISSFLNSHLFQREASISRDFVQNILVADGSLEFLARPDDPVLRERFANTVQHLGQMRDVLRANVFGANRTILWSTDPSLIGRRFEDNDELDEAMGGRLVVHAGQIVEGQEEKPEHVGLDPSVRFFVESYIPVMRPGSGAVVGAVELYKAPLALTEAIQEGRVQVWLTALGSALLLYGTLFGLIRRADRTIKRQHARLLNAEMLAVVGELTSSVAHNIRNPLSSIRACAELTLESPGEDCSDEARDIIAQVDRISGCITELLTYAGTGSGMGGQVDLASLLGECACQSEATFARRRQRIAVDCGAGLFLVRGETSLFRQVILSLIANASEAMGEGGDCVLRLSAPDGRHLQVDIIDSGPGITPDVMGQVFRPFFTTKPKGLGLGLPLAKRIVERFGGSIRVDCRPEGGTTVTLLFSRA